MATVYKIPLRPGRAAQSVFVTLDGRRFRIDLDWLGRIRRWSFSLYTGAGVPLLRCKGLVLGADLLKRIQHNPEAPRGAFFLVDRQEANAEATLDSLGIRHDLIYYPRGE